MKQVTKGAPPATIEDWKAMTSADWLPSYENLQNPEKTKLHDALLEEQGWVCCYCGRACEREALMYEGREVTPGSHIEHFRPQDRYPDLSLSYENLHASCIRQTKPGLPLHCGHAKSDLLNEDMQISPLNAGCEERFVYTFVGDIAATSEADLAATYMIDLLQLDIRFLRNRREEALQQVFDANFISTVSVEELRLLRDAYRQHDAQGRATNFGHVLARYAEQRLSDT